MYQDRFSPNGAGPYELDQRMLRDHRYKLLDPGRGAVQLFDLEGRRDDGRDLAGSSDPELQLARERLERAMVDTVTRLEADE